MLEDIRYNLKENKKENIEFIPHIVNDIEQELINPDNYINIKNHLPAFNKVRIEYNTCKSECGYTYLELTIIDNSTGKGYRIDYCEKCKELGLHTNDT